MGCFFMGQKGGAINLRLETCTVTKVIYRCGLQWPQQIRKSKTLEGLNDLELYFDCAFQRVQPNSSSHPKKDIHAWILETGKVVCYKDIAAAFLIFHLGPRTRLDNLPWFLNNPRLTQTGRERNRHNDFEATAYCPPPKASFDKQALAAIDFENKDLIGVCSDGSGECKICQHDKAQPQ